MDAVFRFFNQKYGPKDYLEDGLDNIYFNKCGSCDEEFLGDKRRYCCKECTMKYEAKLAAMTPDERQKHDEEIQLIYKETMDKLHP